MDSGSRETAGARKNRHDKTNLWQQRIRTDNNRQTKTGWNRLFRSVLGILAVQKRFQRYANYG